MKIAVVGNPWIKTPPHGHGGIEEMTHLLTEELVKRGHEVYLYATGDSETNAHLLYFYEKALGNDASLKLNPYLMLDHLEHFFKIEDKYKFDLIHFNSGKFGLYFLSFTSTPFVITWHNPLTPAIDDPYKIVESGRSALQKHKNFPYISVSHSQRQGLPDLNYITNIYNGINIEDFVFSVDGGNDALWLGRIMKAKGLDIALKAVDQLKKPLRIRGSVDNSNKEYSNAALLDLINRHDPSFTEIKNAEDKSQFLGSGRVFLHTPRWEEPFGLAIIEAMACGTPVIALAKGALPEIIKDGQTGFLINPSDDDTRGNFITKKSGIEGLCEAMERLYSMPEDEYRDMRANCRKHVMEHFTVQRMVDEYEKIYNTFVSKT